MATSDTRAGKTFELTLPDGFYTIGRASDNNLMIEDKAVSSHHVKITSFFKSAYIEDLSSTNGVTVNGEKVHKCILHKGDYFEIAQFKFIIVGFERG